MGISKNNPQSGQALFLLGVCMLVAMTFNNCGQTPPQDSVINQSYEKRIADTKIIYGHVLDQNFCADSSNYSCNRKIYSPHIQDSKKLLKDVCLPVGEGSILCPTGLELRFNTQTAIENCGPACPDTFDYEDAQCSLVLPNMLGENPINESGRNLGESLSKVFNACLDALSKEAR